MHSWFGRPYKVGGRNLRCPWQARRAAWRDQRIEDSLWKGVQLGETVQSPCGKDVDNGSWRRFLLAFTFSPIPRFVVPTVLSKEVNQVQTRKGTTDRSWNVILMEERDAGFALQFFLGEVSDVSTWTQSLVMWPFCSVTCYQTAYEAL